MNEKAQELINQAGEKVLAYLEATEGFAMEQAPLLAQEVLSWGLWYYSSGFIGWVALSILLFVAGNVFRQAILDPIDTHYQADKDLFMVAIIAVAALPLTGALACMTLVVKILVAPRLYIIEQIGRLF